MISGVFECAMCGEASPLSVVIDKEQEEVGTDQVEYP